MKLKKQFLCSAMMVCVWLTAHSQSEDNTDWWGWHNVTVHVPVSKKVDGQLIYSYALQDNISSYFLNQVAARASISLPNRWSITPGYEFFTINDFSNAHIMNVQIRKGLSLGKLNPFLRLELDYVVFTQEETEEGTENNPRVRFQGGIAPKLNSFTTLIVNTEPFIYRNEGFFSEWRTLAGFAFKVHERIQVSTLFFNRWRGGDPKPSFRWQNAYYLGFNIWLHKNSKRSLNPSGPNLAN